MKAICKRELRSYFNSPIGYIYLAVFVLFAGFLFVSYNLSDRTTSMVNLFTYLFNYNFVLVPILTMRLFSEERKQKTDQLLLTSPVSISGIVTGKMLSSFIIYCIGGAITLVFALFMAVYSSVPWLIVLTSYFGFALAGAVLIAMGTFFSALTENQIVAIIISFIVFLFYVLFYDSLVKQITVVWLQKVLLSISITQAYGNFTFGLIDLPSVILLLSMTVLFMFFTVRIIDRRRWS